MLRNGQMFSKLLKIFLSDLSFYSQILLFGYIFWYFYLIQIHSLIFAPEFIVNTLLI
jgi:hypothetical protein